MKFAAPLGLKQLEAQQIEAVANPDKARGVDLPTIELAAQNKTWLCGTSEMIVEHLKKVEEKYPGLDRINLGSTMGMPKQVFKDQLTKFAETVMPAFQN